ncbi:MAG: ATP-dependent helicase [Lachnospiraceae bacterium]
MCSHFQESYSYFCVDEAQVSKIQHDMIRLLSEKSGNLFMVGDEDQSIYGFRAAYPEALVDFEAVHPGASVLLMESNYRSGQRIVEAADRFIQKNVARRRKHMTPWKDMEGKVRRITLQNRESPVRISSSAGQGEKRDISGALPESRKCPAAH